VDTESSSLQHVSPMQMSIATEPADCDDDYDLGIDDAERPRTLQNSTLPASWLVRRLATRRSLSMIHSDPRSA
jgi:hypothetical protein